MSRAQEHRDVRWYRQVVSALVEVALSDGPGAGLAVATLCDLARSAAGLPGAATVAVLPSAQEGEPRWALQ